MGAVIDVLEHPAVLAWAKLLPAVVAPTSIAVLRDRDKGAVYRLAGVGLTDSPVIAKHCQTTTGLIERCIYEEILPHVPVTALHYYGYVADADGSSWLFLEDAGGVPLAADLEEHRVLAAHWLALLHTFSARVAAAARLPDRGPAHYLDHLRSAREVIIGVRTASAPRRDREVLDAIVAECDVIESDWHAVEDACASAPPSLVHGDFRPKNVHVRTTDVGDRLFAMDWETAGWGVPAADLTSIRGLQGETIGLSTYLMRARERWPTLDTRTIRRLVEIGRLFRRLAAISWSSLSLASRWEKAIAHLQVHEAALAALIEAAKWTR